MDWKKLDEIKRRLFRRLRDETRFDYSQVDFQEYRQRFKRIPDRLLEEWSSIETECKSHKDLPRFKGPLYEALFYYACLDMQALFFDAELAVFGGQPSPEHPPWFVAIPLYDIIPQLHQVRENGKWKRIVPQVGADFLISYVDDQGPAAPALVDVKSSRPSYEERFGWQNTAALRMGFIFQIAYPKNGVEYPRNLKEWEIKTPCDKCKSLSDDFRNCDNCGEQIFPFTIVDARYRLKDLAEKLGWSYHGRY